MATVHCKTCGQWCDEEDSYCSSECADGHVECDACLGTGIGQFGDPDTSKCSNCGGRGYTICAHTQDEIQASADFERKRRIEDRMLEAMDD